MLMPGSGLCAHFPDREAIEEYALCLHAILTVPHPGSVGSVGTQVKQATYRT